MNKRVRLAYPYMIFAVLFTIVPLVLVFVFAFLKKTPDGYTFTLEYVRQLADPSMSGILLTPLLRALKLSVIATAVCLLIGYPTALILASPGFRHKGFLLTLLVLPMWMNFLVRTYAWMAILENTGFLNQFLSLFGLGPFQFLYTEGAVAMGMVYNYLPFMILPIHSVLMKIDHRLIEAAQDLGANPFRVFCKVTFPLSLGGVVSGITMVFMPSVTTFAISGLLGGNKSLLIGDVIERYFLEFNNWGIGSLISGILLIVILVCSYVMTKFQKEDEGGRLF